MKQQIRTLVLTVLFSMVALTVAAQTVTHVVERGETIETIAAKYGITTEALLKANPEAADFFFVGMKLQIPASEAATDKTLTKTKPATLNATTRTESQSTESTSQWGSSEKKSSPFKLKVIGGLTMAKWGGDDMKSTQNSDGSGAKAKTKNIFNYHIGLVGSYFYSEGGFVSLGGIFNVKGYKQTIEESSGRFWDDEGVNYDGSTTDNLKSQNIEVLLHFGGKIDFSESVSIKLYGGPFATFNIGGELTSKGDVTVNPDVWSGETEHINNKTKIGKGDLKNYRKTTFGLSAGVGVQVSHFVLDFTYEAGLQQMLKKRKMYDQCMLLSVGYEF